MLPRRVLDDELACRFDKPRGILVLHAPWDPADAVDAEADGNAEEEEEQEEARAAVGQRAAGALEEARSRTSEAPAVGVREGVRSQTLGVRVAVKAPKQAELLSALLSASTLPRKIACADLLRLSCRRQRRTAQREDW